MADRRAWVANKPHAAAALPPGHHPRGRAPDVWSPIAQAAQRNTQEEAARAIGHGALAPNRFKDFWQE